MLPQGTAEGRLNAIVATDAFTFRESAALTTGSVLDSSVKEDLGAVATTELFRVSMAGKGPTAVVAAGSAEDVLGIVTVTELFLDGSAKEGLTGTLACAFSLWTRDKCTCSSQRRRYALLQMWHTCGRMLACRRW